MSDYMMLKKENKKNEKPNNTGIPTQLKQRIEQSSGFSMDDVQVHYNSQNPRKVGALAYTQEDHVYIASGQEKHLPHELGHVIQQKMGAIRPTLYREGFAINDEPDLEKQADEIGAASSEAESSLIKKGSISNTLQLTSIVLNEESTGRDDDSLPLITNVRGESDNRDNKDNLNFGGYAVIKEKFGEKFDSLEYLKKDDLTNEQKDLIGIARTEKGNIWQYDRKYSFIKKGKIYTRTPYQCAEPHAFDKMLSCYREEQDKRLSPIKEREKKSKEEVEEIEGYISEKRKVNEQCTILKTQKDELYKSWGEEGEDSKEEIEKIKKIGEEIQEEIRTLSSSLSKGAKLKMEVLEKNLAAAKAEYEKANREKTDDDEKNKERLKKFVGRLKFNPAQNPDREGKDKTEPTCPVCKQWVDENLKIKKNVFF